MKQPNPLDDLYLQDLRRKVIQLTCEKLEACPSIYLYKPDLLDNLTEPFQTETEAIQFLGSSQLRGYYIVLEYLRSFSPDYDSINPTNPLEVTTEMLRVLVRELLDSSFTLRSEYNQLSLTSIEKLIKELKTKELNL